MDWVEVGQADVAKSSHTPFKNKVCTGFGKSHTHTYLQKEKKLGDEIQTTKRRQSPNQEVTSQKTSFDEVVDFCGKPFTKMHLLELKGFKNPP